MYVCLFYEIHCLPLILFDNEILGGISKRFQVLPRNVLSSTIGLIVVLRLCVQVCVWKFSVRFCGNGNDMAVKSHLPQKTRTRFYLMLILVNTLDPVLLSCVAWRFLHHVSIATSTVFTAVWLSMVYLGGRQENTIAISEPKENPCNCRKSFDALCQYCQRWWFGPVIAGTFMLAIVLGIFVGKILVNQS